MAQKTIPIGDVNQLILLGLHDRNIRIVEKNYSARFIVRNGEIIVTGEDSELERIEKLFSELIYLANRNNALSEQDIQTAVNILTGHTCPDLCTFCIHRHINFNL